MKILSLQNYKDKEIHPQSKHMLLNTFLFINKEINRSNSQYWCGNTNIMIVLP